MINKKINNIILFQNKVNKKFIELIKTRLNVF